MAYRRIYREFESQANLRSFNKLFLRFHIPKEIDWWSCVLRERFWRLVSLSLVWFMV